MTKLTKIAGAITLATLMSAPALAETATGNAAVSVSNAFTLAEDSRLDFGTIRAQVATVGATTTDVATMTLPANGSNPTIDNAATSGDSVTKPSINVITQGTPGTFSVSGAAPNSVLTITLPGSAFNLTTASGGASFSATVNDAYITSGPNANRTYNAGTDPLITDATGAVTFDVGGTLSTDAAGSATNYRDQEYTGTYTMTVAY